MVGELGEKGRTTPVPGMQCGAWDNEIVACDREMVVGDGNGIA